MRLFVHLFKKNQIQKTPNNLVRYPVFVLVPPSVMLPLMPRCLLKFDIVPDISAEWMSSRYLEKLPGKSQNTVTSSLPPREFFLNVWVLSKNPS